MVVTGGNQGPVALDAPNVSRTLSGSTLTLSWPHVANAGQYDVRYNGSTSNLTPVGNIGSTNDPSWNNLTAHYNPFGGGSPRGLTFTNLQEGKRYVLYVFSLSGSSGYVNSSPTKVIVEVPVSTPTNPNPVIQTFSIPSSAIVGQAKTFSITVANTGDANATDLNISFADGESGQQFAILPTLAPEIGRAHV